MRFIFTKRKSRLKLNSILETACILVKNSDIKEVRENPVYSLIRAMTNYHLYEIVRELYEDEEVTDVNKLLEDIGVYVTKPQIIENGECFELSEGNIYTDLAKDAVVLCAWNKDRFIEALSRIGCSLGNSFKFDKINHMALYIYPVGITIIYNGNHSSLAGILKGEGIIYPNQVYDLTPTYNFMYFDGTYFRRKSDDRILHKVSRFEIGAIYEIGRILVKNSIK